MRMIITSLVMGICCSTSAMALDLPVTGLELNTEVKAFHKVEAETNHLTIEPELRYTPGVGPLSIWAEVPMTVYETGHASGDDFAITNIWEDGHKPTLELGADITLGGGVTAYGETTWNFNTEDRGEVEVGVSFNF